MFQNNIRSMISSEGPSVKGERDSVNEHFACFENVTLSIALKSISNCKRFCTISNHPPIISDPVYIQNEEIISIQELN